MRHTKYVRIRIWCDCCMLFHLMVYFVTWQQCAKHESNMSQQYAKCETNMFQISNEDEHFACCFHFLFKVFSNITAGCHIFTNRLLCTLIFSHLSPYYILMTVIFSNCFTAYTHLLFDAAKHSLEKNWMIWVTTHINIEPCNTPNFREIYLDEWITIEYQSLLWLLLYFVKCQQCAKCKSHMFQTK